MVEESIFAFVLMPFDREFDDIYKFGIKETAKVVGIRAERVDEQLYSEGVLARIYNQIDRADLIIADMSGRNANVFYEVGYAHAKNKLCIHLTQDAEDIPFDLQHQRHIVYDASIEVLRSKLQENFEWAKQEIANYRKTKIRVKLNEISTALEKGAFSVTGILNFSIDLFNDSESVSQEIESLYFYSGQEWRIQQSGIGCEYGESDLPPFKYRYFLRPPQNKISRSSWLPLRFTASKVLGTSLAGIPLESSYPVRGRSVLRIGTAAGVFDHELSIDVVCLDDDIPF